MKTGIRSFFLQWKKEMLPDEGLEDCCNVHDYCYDKCGADRDICDLEFKTCLYKICKKRKDEWAPNEMKSKFFFVIFFEEHLIWLLIN